MNGETKPSFEGDMVGEGSRRKGNDGRWVGWRVRLGASRAGPVGSARFFLVRERWEVEEGMGWDVRLRLGSGERSSG